MRMRMLAVVLLSLCAASSSSSAQAHPPSDWKVAIFAGGCFWCMEPQFKDVPGVQDARVGYTGGTTSNPSYSDVSSGSTGHVEAISITYDPARVSYDTLLNIFWHNIDPLDDKGQFCDHGSQYRAAIFYDGEEQRAAAEASKEKVQKDLGEKVATLIVPAHKFWYAEDYHQEFYIKNRDRYENYKKKCGRDARLEDIWQQAEE